MYWIQDYQKPEIEFLNRVFSLNGCTQHRNICCYCCWNTNYFSWKYSSSICNHATQFLPAVRKSIKYYCIVNLILVTKIFQHFILQNSLWNIPRALLFATEKKIRIFFPFSKHFAPTTLLNFSSESKRRGKKNMWMGHICRGIFVFFSLNFISHARKGRTKDGIANDWRHLKEIVTGVHRAHFLNAICIEMFHLTKLNFVIPTKDLLSSAKVIVRARHCILVYHTLLLVYRLNLTIESINL